MNLYVIKHNEMIVGIFSDERLANQEKAYLENEKVFTGSLSVDYFPLNTVNLRNSFYSHCEV